MTVITTYLLYAIVSIGLTVWVGRTLFKNGRIFLVDSFDNDETMADAVNMLLLTGFYLLNFGFVAMFLRYGTEPTNTVEAIEYVSTKLGVVLIVLGLLHFFNVFNFAKMRGKSRRRKEGQRGHEIKKESQPLQSVPQSA